MRKAFYPWLFSIVPIAHLYSVNLGLVRDAEAVVVMLLSLVATTAVYGSLRLANGNHDKACAISAAMVMGFLMFGHLATIPGKGWITLVVLAATLGGFSLLVLRRYSSEHSQTVTPILNLAALCLLLMPVARMSTHWMRSVRAHSSVGQSSHVIPSHKTRQLNGPGRPDVYYIIADGYSSNSFLMRHYSYDNSRFTQALEGLGFFVAYESKSNYGLTLPSLASSLNMEYISSNASSSRFDDVLYLRTLIADSAVAREFSRRGYTYVYVNSGFLLMSESADVLIDVNADGIVDPRRGDPAFDRFLYLKIDSFYNLALETTPLRAFRTRLQPLMDPRGRFPLRWQDRRRFLLSTDILSTIPRMPEATFTFVHLIAPHGPVRFGKEGQALKIETWTPSQQQFLDQIEFVNGRLLGTLRAIIAGSAEPPIIILQADHGTELGVAWTPEHKLTNFEILNAFLLPGKAPAGITRDISPINTFRVLLNEHFGARYEELPVRHFDLPRGYEAPFDQIDVTGQFGSDSPDGRSRTMPPTAPAESAVENAETRE